MRALRDSREIREVFKGLWEGRGLSEGWEQRSPHHRMGCGCGSVGLARWEDSHQTTQSLSNKQSSLLCAEPWFQYVGDNTTSDAGYLTSFFMYCCLDFCGDHLDRQRLRSYSYSNVLTNTMIILFQGPRCAGHPCVGGLHCPSGLCLLWTCR